MLEDNWALVKLEDKSCEETSCLRIMFVVCLGPKHYAHYPLPPKQTTNIMLKHDVSSHDLSSSLTSAQLCSSMMYPRMMYPSLFRPLLSW